MDIALYITVYWLNINKLFPLLSFFIYGGKTFLVFSSFFVVPVYFLHNMGCEYWRNSLVGCSRHSPRFFLLFGVLHIRQFFDVTSWVLGWVSLRKCWFLSGIRLIQYSGSVLGDNNKTFWLKSYAPVVSFVYSGFFFVFIFCTAGGRFWIRKLWSRGCTNDVASWRRLSALWWWAHLFTYHNIAQRCDTNYAE